MNSKRTIIGIITSLIAIFGVSFAFIGCGARNADISSAEIVLSQASYVYDGTPHYPDVTVNLDGSALDTSSYSVAYSNNTNAGTATVTVTGTGNGYFGTVTKDFTIEKAESKMSTTVSLTAQYNKRLGDIIGTEYPISGGDLNVDSRLTIIGNNTYSFQSLYVSTDPNYKDVMRTVNITVTKADPDALADIESKDFSAKVGQKYSDILPAGVTLKGQDGVFNTTGKQTLDVYASQLVDGVPDTENYKQVETKVDVLVTNNEFVKDSYQYEYNTSALTVDSDGRININGDVTVFQKKEAFGNFSTSFTLKFEKLDIFDMHFVFDNVKDKETYSGGIQHQRTKFNFDRDGADQEPIKGYIKSSCGGCNFNYNEPEVQKPTDLCPIPTYDRETGIKIKIDSTINDGTRVYDIYVNDTKIFGRSTGRMHQFWFEYIFEGAKNLEITEIEFVETPYTHSKFAVNYGLYCDNDTFKDENKSGLLMLGDSLVDYWGIDYDDKTVYGHNDLEANACRDIFEKYGFDKPVVDLGIGGTTAEQWLNYVETHENEIKAIDPEVIFLLIGCNQIGNEDELNIGYTVNKLIDRLTEIFPDKPLFVNSIMPTNTKHTNRWNFWEHYAAANEIVSAHVSGLDNNKKVTFLNFSSIFAPDPSAPISNDNVPRADYHANDGLHFKKSAYEIWTRKLLNAMAESGNASDIVNKTDVTINYDIKTDNAASDAHVIDDVKKAMTVEYSMINGKLWARISIDNDAISNAYAYMIKDLTFAYADEQARSVFADFNNVELIIKFDTVKDSATLTVSVNGEEDPDDNPFDDSRFDDDLAGAVVILEYDTVVYDNSSKEPTITVKLNGVVISSDYYNVIYANNTNVGTASVTVTAKDGSVYKGSKTVNFEITKLIPTNTADISNLHLTAYVGDTHSVLGLPVGVTLKTPNATFDSAGEIKITVLLHQINGDGVDDTNYTTTEAELTVIVGEENPDDNNFDDNNFVSNN